MHDFDPDLSFTEDPLLASIRREFCDGLATRIETLRSAVIDLDAGYSVELADKFFRAAHSLKGTAPSFGAHELAEHAAILAEAGRAWVSMGHTSTKQLRAAWREVEHLSAAAERFKTAVASREG